MCLNNMTHRLFTLAIIVTLCTAFALPNHETKRILDKPLSSQEHFIEGEHNSAYDHEAFLGDDARVFDDLTPEESRRRLGLIYDKIDRDGDGFVNASELTKWIQWTQRRYLVADGQKQWKIHNINGKDKLSWNEYKKTTYGFLENEAKDSDEYKTYSRMMGRDRRRWLVADQDSDDALTVEEFQNFLHPEDVTHMHDIIVIETIEDIDKDGDGKISLEEYISDLYRGETGDDEPGWVQSERETFLIYRDKNTDGFLDHAEVKQWIMPQDYNHADAESHHLIHSADSNSDGKLTKDEVLDKYEVFVGSQATDFGEALIKHEEF